MAEQITAEEFDEKMRRFMLCHNAKYDYFEFVDLFSDGENIPGNDKLENSKVMKVMDFAIANDKELRKPLSPDTVFYRARLVRNFKTELGCVLEGKDYLDGFDYFGSKEPHCIAGASGRCNVCGTSYLYGAEDEVTACAEVKPEYSEIISLGKFVLKHQMVMIDFADDRMIKELRACEKEYNVSVASLITWIMLQYAKDYGSTGYRVCQYITDYFRKAGYDGIIYRSSQTNHKCYVFFKSHKKFIDFMGSELVYADRKNYAFAKLKNIDEVRQDGKQTDEAMNVWIESNEPRTSLENLRNVVGNIKKARGKR